MRLADAGVLARCVVVGLAGLAMVASACRAGGGPSAPAPATAIAAQAATVGPASSVASGSGGPASSRTSPGGGIGVRSFTFVDTSRDSRQPARKTAGSTSAGRTIVAEVYYPTTGSAPFPIVVFSHGLRGLPGDYRALWSTWVAAGIAVVAPVYPMTSRGAPEIEAADLPNQPADASFVLTQVLQRAEEPADSLHNLLDVSHVAAAGHSEGALTTVGLFTACCRDSRLRAGIVLAGDAIGFERYPFTGAMAPMLFVHGDADPLVPIGLARQAYARVPWSKAFITLPGAAHIPPYVADDNPAGGVVHAATTDFLNWVLRGDPASLQALRKDASVPGVATLEDQL